MSTHIELGKNGESLAVAYLISRGYEILHTNWRYSYYEIDIIARKGKKIHFVEVKTRKSVAKGYPEENVTRKKFKFLQKAADEYLQQNPQNKWIQYDVLSITLKNSVEPDFFVLEDIFIY